MLEINVTAQLDGLTIKEYFRRNGFSRGLVTRLKKIDRGITVNGEHATVRQVLCCGDKLCLLTGDVAGDENENLVPAEMPLDIIYEDDDMIAVNKPVNMATHPSIGHFDDTLANGLAYYFLSRSEPFVFRAVNRLDRDTSGVVLVAKNRLTAAKLGDAMQKGYIRKQYIAMINGVLSPESGSISTHIRRRDGGIILREVCAADAFGAKSAVTEYKTLLSNSEASIVNAVPITGRTHQLRVHFSHMGTPIIGDSLYGTAQTAPTELDGLINRQALHASVLAVQMGGREMCFEAKLPYDMEMLWRRIEGEK